MGIFGRKKNKDYVDLTKVSSSKKEGEKSKRPPVEPKDEVLDLTKSSGQEKAPSESYSYSKNTSEEKSQGTAGFFGGFFSGNTQPSQEQNEGLPEKTERETSKKLPKITEQIEDLSNQIYRLQQRVEVLERKLQTERRL